MSGSQKTMRVSPLDLPLCRLEPGSRRQFRPSSVAVSMFPHTGRKCLKTPYHWQLNVQRGKTVCNDPVSDR